MTSHFFSSGEPYHYVDIAKVARAAGTDIASLPYVLRVMLENLCRHRAWGDPIDDSEIAALLKPAPRELSALPLHVNRVILPDSSGLPVLQALAALRDAVAEYGHHGSPTQALAFYRRLADEVNAACTAGRVPALDRRSSFLPPWIPEYTAALPRTWFGAWRFVLTLQGFDARPKPSADGPAEIEDVFRDLTRTPTSPHAGAPGLPLQHQWEDGRGRLARGVAGLYGEVLPWLFGGAVLALAGAVALQVIARRVLLSAVLAAAALAGAAAVITVVTLVDLTSFGAVCIGYLASSYPLVLLFVPLSGVALYDAGRTWQQRRASPAGPGSAPMA